MRFLICPNGNCRRHLIFSDKASRIQCGSCRKQFSVAAVDPRGVVNVTSSEDELALLQSRAWYLESIGAFGSGRSGMINRMIDGVDNYDHIVLLREFFENFGIKDGEVRRLSEMGQTEPIDPTSISDYAFALREEHIDVDWYGKNEQAGRYLRDAIQKIGSVNSSDGGEACLIPVAAGDEPWMLNAAGLVSRACVGRETFSKRIADAALHHLRKFGDEYKKRFQLASVVWSSIKSQNPFVRFDSRHFLGCNLDLAALANVVRRPILLFDATPPFLIDAFVPFLCRPEECRDRNGVLRTPLVLAWSDESRRARVALVSTVKSNSIAPIRLPGEWFNSIREKQDGTLLTQYVNFDERNTCLVAHGKYFKPEFMRYMVESFEAAATEKRGVSPRLLAKYAWGCCVGNKDGAETDLMVSTVDKLLRRCVDCEWLTKTDAWAKQPACSLCSSTEHMRVQNADDSIEYKNGDHTTTPAPNSWCYKKQKHFFDGIQYDNPPLSIKLWISTDDQNRAESDGRPIRAQSATFNWFSGESNNFLNSRIEHVLDEVILKCNLSGVDLLALTDDLKEQVRRQVTSDSLLELRKKHLTVALGKSGGKGLLDDCEEISSSESHSPMLDGTPTGTPESINELFNTANETSLNFFHAVSEIDFAAKNGRTPAQQRQLDELNKIQSELEEQILEGLRQKTSMYDDWQLAYTICTRTESFRLGGFFYHYAKRRGYTNAIHFELPLLKNLHFTFCDVDDVIVVCLPDGHFLVHEAINEISSAMSSAPVPFKCGAQESTEKSGSVL